MKYLYQQWAPDQAEIGRGGLRDAKNVIPQLTHFEPFPALVESGSAVNTRPLGGAGFRDQSTVVHLYVGDTAKLYERTSSGGWTDRSKGGGYVASAATRWRFAQFGDRAIAVNGQDAPQYIEMTAGTAYADLPGSPGVAQHVAQYSEFVFLGNTGVSGAQLKWCAQGDSSAWTAGVNQSDAQTFPDGGSITGLTGGIESLIVFQEKTVRRGIYVGPPLIMAFTAIEEERGCAASGSIAKVGRLIFFLAEDGFYQLTDGGAISVGAQLVDAWFKADAQRDYFYRMSSVIDPYKKLYLVAYASRSSPSGLPDTILIYNYAVKKWAYARCNTELLFSVLTQSVSLEDLDAIYGSLDAIPLSLDDPLFAGGVLTLGAMTENKKIATFSGAALEATIETDDVLLDGMATMFIGGALPLGDVASTYVSVAGRMTPNATKGVYSAESAMHAATGKCPQRKTARWARFKQRIPAAASWTKIEGLEIDMQVSGDR